MKKNLINQFLLRIILIACLSAAIYIISTDLGNFAAQPAGAGDIWWVDIPQVHESYNKLSILF